MGGRDDCRLGKWAGAIHGCPVGPPAVLDDLLAHLVVRQRCLAIWRTDTQKACQDQPSRLGVVDIMMVTMTYPQLGANLPPKSPSGDFMKDYRVF